ncbi:hypothetical protein TNCV_2462181 [Trichonephila clavipes]|nr:hypothetical protein TNCV_2462181 [Trichonephila clavipes]
MALKIPKTFETSLKSDSFSLRRSSLRLNKFITPKTIESGVWTLQAPRQLLNIANVQSRSWSVALLVRLMEGEKRWEAPDLSQDVLSENWSGTEQNRTVTCMVLKAKANDRRKNLALSCVEFR